MAASGALPDRFDERLIERPDRPPAARQGTVLVALEPPQLTHQFGSVDLVLGAVIRIRHEASKHVAAHLADTVEIDLGLSERACQCHCRWACAVVRDAPRQGLGQVASDGAAQAVAAGIAASARLARLAARAGARSGVAAVRLELPWRGHDRLELQTA